MKKIAVKDPSLLFYNNACDAFCGKTTFFKEAEFASNVTATLQRPFCKVVFMEKDEANFSIGKSMNITLKMPTEYNVSTEKPLNQTEVNHSREFAADELTPIPSASYQPPISLPLPEKNLLWKQSP